MDKKLAKKIWKLAAVIFLASFLIINWNDVSWIFNYKEVTGLVSDFFNPYPSIDANTINAYFYPNHSQDIVAVKEVKTIYTSKQNTLEIPRISISVPIVFPTSTDKTVIEKDLNSGTVYYPGSVYPGQTGQAIVLGHSAPPGWPNIKYDWVFTNLNKLSVGDVVLIDLNNKQYKYIVRSKTIIQRGADVPVDELASKNNVLTLISCWPPGKDYQRIAVVTELVDNK
jgi:LPXTG-site transpeptidase (sortase) family protein